MGVSRADGGLDVTRVSPANTDAERRVRMLRDITAVLNLRLLCPDDADEMADALGLSDVSHRMRYAEAELLIDRWDSGPGVSR